MSNANIVFRDELKTKAKKESSLRIDEGILASGRHVWIVFETEVDAAENAGASLEQIGRALSHNWSAAVVALALRNTGTLRALIDEA
jgi:hypothetical protein